MGTLELLPQVRLHSAGHQRAQVPGVRGKNMKMIMPYCTLGATFLVLMAGCAHDLTVKVVDARSRTPISGASIGYRTYDVHPGILLLPDLCPRPQPVQWTDSSGETMFEGIKCGDDFIVTKEGYALYQFSAGLGTRRTVRLTPEPKCTPDVCPECGTPVPGRDSAKPDDGVD